MNSKIDLTRQTRSKALEIISGLSISELNKIPEGFNNNIIWNLGHLIAAQEGIFYLRGKLELNIEQDFFNSFKNGSRPEREIHAEEIEKIRSLLFSSLDQFESDLDKNAFHNYPAWTTSMGIQINSIEDALDFLPFHEGLHLGHIMAYKRIILNKE
ncbi:MAG: DinB family protein [Pedobacter sp.]|nr:DinB family protein [Pedobacter sp.]